MQSRNINRYGYIKAWMASRDAKRGLERMQALGAVWAPRSRTDQIVEALGRADCAPELPKLDTFRDRGSFLAGAAWALSWIGNKAEAGR